MLRVLDLFSGIGGFSLGLERTGGFRTIAFCEIDPYCQRVLGKHWPRVPCFSDVRVLTADVLRYWSIERPDIICGGFPCQDISLAGKGAGLSGERSALWFEYHRLIAETRPAFAIIENVSALRARGLDKVLGSLAAIGYDAEWHCIPASHVGAPHRRDRVWIIAYPQRDELRDEPGWRSGTGRAGETEPANDGETESLAHADGLPSCPKRPGDSQERTRGRHAHRGGICANLGDSDREGQPEGSLSQEWRWLSDPSWWGIEPDVGRVADGVPARIHRLRALGNSVVPQIPEIIGHAILHRLQ